MSAETFKRNSEPGRFVACVFQRECGAAILTDHFAHHTVSIPVAIAHVARESAERLIVCSDEREAPVAARAVRGERPDRLEAEGEAGELRFGRDFRTKLFAVDGGWVSWTALDDDFHSMRVALKFDEEEKKRNCSHCARATKSSLRSLHKFVGAAAPHPKHEPGYCAATARSRAGRQQAITSSALAISPKKASILRSVASCSA